LFNVDDPARFGSGQSESYFDHGTARFSVPAGQFDITTGTNDLFASGAACGRDYLCVAKNGYDAPTGLGTPDGTGAF